jgi:type I restriction enzyme, S subunit
MSTRRWPAWRRTSLGEYLQIKHGYAFKGEFFANEGPYVLLTPGNFKAEGGLQSRGEREKYYVGHVPSEFLLQRGDFLVVMTDLTQDAPILGSPAIIPAGRRFLHNQRLGKVVDLDEERLDRRYLYYLFNFYNVRDQIKATATGATVRHTAPERIYSVEVHLPPIGTQERIADILSAYDDLIENNTRRIAILEKMAQTIYREWFVNFRFPGHEQVELVDSDLGPIPDGWEAKRLGDLAEEVRRTVDPRELDPDTPYFGLEHLPRRSIALSDWGRAADVQSTKLSFNEGEILFGKIRPYFHKVGIAPLAGICSTDAIVIVPKRRNNLALVLCCVSSEVFVAHATQTSQGTKMPRANWNILVDYPVVMPPDVLLARFTETVGAMTWEIVNLIFQNRNLRATRDLLLPRLVSGELDVSDLTEPETAGA